MKVLQGPKVPMPSGSWFCMELAKSRVKVKQQSEPMIMP